MMNGKKITQKELDRFLKKHKLWLTDDPKGKHANLCGANLCGANLRNANLCGANLCGANLYCRSKRFLRRQMERMFGWNSFLYYKR